MASTVAEWVVTLDEDGQQDPRDIGRMLDEALTSQRATRLCEAYESSAAWPSCATYCRALRN